MTSVPRDVLAVSGGTRGSRPLPTVRRGQPDPARVGCLRDSQSPILAVSASTIRDVTHIWGIFH